MRNIISVISDIAKWLSRPAVQSVRCLVVSGLGVAHHTLPLQTRHIRSVIPDFPLSELATLNLLAEKPVIIRNPSAETGTVSWHPEMPPENFRLTEVSIENVTSGMRGYGVIYQPSRSPHVVNKASVEVVCYFRMNPTSVRPGDEIILHFPKPLIDKGFALVYD